MLIYHYHEITIKYHKMNTGYYGTYHFQMDEHRRISIPADFRRQFSEPGNKIYLQLIDNCIRCYTPKELLEISRLITQDPPFSAEARAKRRGWGSTLMPRTIDPQGRIMLTDDLITEAAIVKDIVIIGTLDSFEIWAKEVYEKSRSENPDLWI